MGDMLLFVWKKARPIIRVWRVQFHCTSCTVHSNPWTSLYFDSCWTSPISVSGLFLLDERTDCSLCGWPFKVIQGRWASWVVCYWARTTAILNVPWDQRPWMTLSGHYPLLFGNTNDYIMIIVYACFHSPPQRKMIGISSETETMWAMPTLCIDAQSLVGYFSVMPECSPFHVLDLCKWLLITTYKNHVKGVNDRISR